MTEVIVFPDVVSAVIDYLDTELGSTDVVQSVPKPRPDRLVRILRTGGPRLDLIREQAQITVDCWDTRTDTAHDLAAVCRGLIYAMPDRYSGITTYRVQEIAGLADSPDPDTALPRWTFTVLIDVRGTVLDES